VIVSHFSPSVKALIELFLRLQTLKNYVTQLIPYHSNLKSRSVTSYIGQNLLLTIAPYMGVSWAPLHIKNTDPINKYRSKLECVLLSVTSELGTVL
jgi:hypothetical protein